MVIKVCCTVLFFELGRSVNQFSTGQILYLRYLFLDLTFVANTYRLLWTIFTSKVNMKR